MTGSIIFIISFMRYFVIFLIGRKEIINNLEKFLYILALTFALLIFYTAIQRFEETYESFTN